CGRRSLGRSVEGRSSQSNARANRLVPSGRYPPRYGSSGRLRSTNALDLTGGQRGMNALRALLATCGSQGASDCQSLLRRASGRYPPRDGSTGRLRSTNALAVTGGQRGIRTLEGLLTLTPLAGVRLRPLGHLSALGRSTVARGISPPHAHCETPQLAGQKGQVNESLSRCQASSPAGARAAMILKRGW